VVHEARVYSHAVDLLIPEPLLAEVEVPIGKSGLVYPISHYYKL
jgi:hypothetical protein